jgi:probable F420-dependent oxidoreductase
MPAPRPTSDVGVWTPAFQWPATGPEAGEAAAELEQLGYGSVWLGMADPGLELVGRLVAATRQLTVATGIVSIWAAPPDQVAARWAEIDAVHPDRVLLGLGNSHHVLVEPTGRPYEKPYTRTALYLDGLDAASPRVPTDRRVLAALGPRMLALAATRAAGAHPYLTTPEHTAEARRILGDGPFLAPEQKVVLTTDADAARAIARPYVQMYLSLPNYANNLRRLGFGDDDLTGDPSDEVVDALVAWGDEETVAARVRAHLDAGADHALVQVLEADASALPREALRRLAPALLRT